MSLRLNLMKLTMPLQNNMVSNYAAQDNTCPEFSVRLQLINFPYPKFAAFNIGTSPQRIFNLRLRQNKSGGRFFALRSVNLFDLLGFGGEDSIQKT